MARPTLESIEKAQQRVDQAKARLQALQARASALDRKAFEGWTFRGGPADG